MLKQYSDHELLGQPLSERQKQELLSLLEQPPETIDTSDIPEVRALPGDARRAGDRQWSTRAIWLSEELHAYFTAAAERKGLSVSALVNDILAKEVAIVEAVK